jgi:hypothetical protein
MRGYIKTIADLEQMYYIDPQMRGFLQKSDEPVLSTTSGVYNPIYGAKTWTQFNEEVNAWSILPKEAWTRSGWRVVTARGDTPPVGGVAENAALPETGKPDFAVVTTKPAQVVHTFDTSMVQQFLGKIDDSLGDTMAWLRDYYAKEHISHINKMLLTDNDTLAGDNIESIDRVVGSYAEVTACAPAAGDLDIYGLDRDAAATWADSYVDQNGTTDRTFTMDMLDTAIDTIENDSGYTPNLILTGRDTRKRILQEQLVMQEYIEPKKVSIGMNGVVTEGIEAGFNVASYRGIPIFVSQDVPKDTISRLYLLNTEFMKIRVSHPTMYFENGISKGDPFGIDRLGDEGAYVTLAELICYNFAAQGKIRELK